MSQVPRNLVTCDLVGVGFTAADVVPPADVLGRAPAGTDGEAVTVTILAGLLDAHAVSSATAAKQTMTVLPTSPR